MGDRMLLVVGLLLMCVASTSFAQLPGPEVPAGLGVNIHFTDPKPGEMKMLAAGGFGIVRMDCAWSGIEREKGRYDFSAYDRLVDALQQHRIRALFILDYGNPLYEAQFSSDTQASRAAFARWAAVTVKRYAGRGILWEIWNEPNHSGFWRPQPNPANYLKLALAAGKAIREAAPDEIQIGPATSTIDFAFLETCFQGGVLEYWSAVSVHPYRQTNPETVVDEYRKLRLLIDRYAPKGKHIPILSGEWGYTTAWNRFDAQAQAKMLTRQWLVNLSCDVPVSIWYDWHNDGANPKDDESNFGTVAYAYHEGRDPVYDPKPAYQAARTLTSALAGYRFNKRLALDSPDDWVLLFTKGDEVRLVAWTTVPGAGRKVTIPTGPGAFRAIGHVGQPLADMRAEGRGLAVQLTDGPQYLIPQEPNEYLRLVAGWTRLRTDQAVHAPATIAPDLEVRNLTDRPLRVFTWGEHLVQIAPGAAHAVGHTYGVLRTPYPIRMRQQLHIEGFPVAYQESMLTVANPLEVTPLPRMGTKLPVRIGNPSGEAFSGRLTLSGVGATEIDLKLAEGQKDAVVLLPAGGNSTARYSVGVTLVDGDRQPVVEVSRRSCRPIPLDVAAYQLHSDGDANVASEQSAKSVPAPPGLPVAGAEAVRIDYRYAPGWKFIRLAPQRTELQRIEGRPLALGMWIHGDGSGNSPRLRFVDATGQCFQPLVEELTYSGWRYVQFPLDGTQAGHWGGAKDGIVHYPIELDTLLLLDSPTQKGTKGTVHIALPTMVYADAR